MAAFAAVVAVATAPVSGAMAASAAPNAVQPGTERTVSASAERGLGAITVVSGEAMTGASAPKLDGAAVEVKVVPKPVADILAKAGLPVDEVERVVRVGKGVYTVWYQLASDVPDAVLRGDFRSVPAMFAKARHDSSTWIATGMGPKPVENPLVVVPGPSRFRSTMDVLGIPVAAGYGAGQVALTVYRNFYGLLTSVPRAVFEGRFGDVGPLISQAFQKSAAAIAGFPAVQAASAHAKVEAMHAAWNPVVITAKELAAVQAADAAAKDEKAKRAVWTELKEDAARLREAVTVANVLKHRARDEAKAADQAAAKATGDSRDAAAAKAKEANAKSVEAHQKAREAARRLKDATDKVKQARVQLKAAEARTAEAEKAVADARQGAPRRSARATDESAKPEHDAARLTLEGKLAEVTKQAAAATGRRNEAKSQAERAIDERDSLSVLLDRSRKEAAAATTAEKKAELTAVAEGYAKRFRQAGKDYEAAIRKGAEERETESRLTGEIARIRAEVERLNKSAVPSRPASGGPDVNGAIGTAVTGGSTSAGGTVAVSAEPKTPAGESEDSVERPALDAAAPESEPTATDSAAGDSGATAGRPAAPAKPVEKPENEPAPGSDSTDGAGTASSDTGTVASGSEGGTQA